MVRVSFKIRFRIRVWVRVRVSFKFWFRVTVWVMFRLVRGRVQVRFRATLNKLQIGLRFELMLSLG